MIQGGCRYGLVRYQYAGEIGEVVACHCQQCKRAQGGAFALNSPIELALLKFESGRDLLKEYHHTKNKKRVFCGNRGSPIFSQRDDAPETIRLRLGTLDDLKLPEPECHIHHDKAVEWCSFDKSPSRHPTEKPKTD